jgi:hypothetical protein
MVFPVLAGREPTGMSSIALGDQVGGPPEVQVGERGTELRGELAHLVPATARRMQGVLEADVRGREFADDRGVEVLAPEFSEPAGDDGLVVFGGHGSSLSWR